MEERTIRAQFTTNISYLRILRIFQVVQRAVFCLSTKDNTRRNTAKASAQDELLNSNATAMAVLGLRARETPSEQRPLSNTPLPEEVQNQTLPFGQRLKAWCRPSPGLHVELAEGKAPHPQKVHLQVEHEVVKPFFRNAVMEAHCKRGDGTDVNREPADPIPSSPGAPRPPPLRPASRGSLRKECRVPSAPPSKVMQPRCRDTQTPGSAPWSPPQTSFAAKKMQLRRRRKAGTFGGAGPREGGPGIR